MYPDRHTVYIFITIIVHFQFHLIQSRFLKDMGYLRTIVRNDISVPLKHPFATITGRSKTERFIFKTSFRPVTFVPVAVVQYHFGFHRLGINRHGNRKRGIPLTTILRSQNHRKILHDRRIVRITVFPKPDFHRSIPFLIGFVAPPHFHPVCLSLHLYMQFLFQIITISRSRQHLKPGFQFRNHLHG